MQYLLAYIISDDYKADIAPNSHADAIQILEDLTNKAPIHIRYLIDNTLLMTIHQIADAVFLLAKLYERHQCYEKAIAMLERHVQSSSISSANSHLHRMLGDFLSKTNRPEMACSEVNWDEIKQIINAYTFSTGKLLAPSVPTRRHFSR